MNENTATQPVVELKDGALMGRIKDAVYLFSGIPYAAPPVGSARFKAAQPVQPWDGIRDATKFGPAAPQIPSGGMTDRVPVRWSEDCLTLNVATPSITGDKKAVLVWIHGGAYRSGQGAIPWYNGSSFATLGNIVVVTINYRLGALGFTDLSSFAEGYETSGVNGLLDQIKALEWVQNNIGAFGGDPERVTIAGESAGAFSVTTLLGAARARGLFHRAIPQSGAAHHTLTQAQGLRVAELLMQETQSTDVQALIDCPVETLLNAQNTASARYHTEHHSPGVQAFYPVSGNEIIPTTLLEAIEAGVGRDIPVLIGTNQDESSLFMLGSSEDSTAETQSKAYGKSDLHEHYARVFPSFSPRDIAVRMATDFSFKLPAIRLAELRAETGSETYVYQFNWASRIPGLGATHALEIPFVFNMLHAPGVTAFIGPGPLPQSLAGHMHDIWIHFINGQAPEWPSYQRADRSVMHFDETSHLENNDYEDVIGLWAGLR
ncbi:MAG: carboxylesterase/lipase family protein [Gammaproteobacteria bacterium]|nr:carboxylesterase/lipase family protein [Gammaproteobacteria bacterium]